MVGRRPPARPGAGAGRAIRCPASAPAGTASIRSDDRHPRVRHGQGDRLAGHRRPRYADVIGALDRPSSRDRRPRAAGDRRRAVHPLGRAPAGPARRGARRRAGRAAHDRPTLQRSLLPAVPASGAVEVHATYAPAQGRWRSAGTGTTSSTSATGGSRCRSATSPGTACRASAMGQLRSAARALALAATSPPTRWPSWTASPSLDGRPLATVVYAILDPETGLLRYACAATRRRCSCAPTGRRRPRGRPLAAAGRRGRGAARGGRGRPSARGHARPLHGRAGRAAGRIDRRRPHRPRQQAAAAAATRGAGRGAAGTRRGAAPRRRGGPRHQPARRQPSSVAS